MRNHIAIGVGRGDMILSDADVLLFAEEDDAWASANSRHV